MLRTLQVQPLSGFIGAEVRGMPIRRHHDPEVEAALKRLLQQHQVLVFRDLFLTIAEQKALTQSFGPLEILPYVEPSEEDPAVIAVLKEAEETGISVFGGDWHSDFSFLLRPPAGSLLSAVEVPPVGGDTLWSSQTAAWEHLPADRKESLASLQAIHVGAPYGKKEPYIRGAGLSRSIRITRGAAEADRPVLHPLVRRHPQTGQPALFVNPIYTRGIAGMPEGEAQDLLDELFRHAVRPDFTCRHRWRAGDLVVWDNRTTLHYAINDYDGHRRLLYRTTFAGERPLGIA